MKGISLVFQNLIQKIQLMNQVSDSQKKFCEEVTDQQELLYLQ